MSGQRCVRLTHPADPDAWRAAARELLLADVPPERVLWQVIAEEPGECGDLFAGEGADADGGAGASDAPAPRAHAAPAVGPRVPRGFVELAADVVCHRDPQRFGRLYRTLHRIAHGERALLEDPSDEDVHALEAMARSVRRDRHKMTAFVRFRRLPCGDGADDVERYAAWFEPEHFVVRSTADFFRRRFATMAFSIFTPEESVHWDTRELRFGPGASRAAVPDVEAMEELWREYYASIFNPARLKLGAMRAEMPVKYWRNLPEASLIGPLSRGAGRRTRAMIDAPATSAPGFARRAGLVGRAADDPPPSGAPDGAPDGAGESCGGEGETTTGARSANAPEG